jgi:hypothetical protein
MGYKKQWDKVEEVIPLLKQEATCRSAKRNKYIRGKI